MEPITQNPDDYVLVKRGVLIGAAIILEKATQRLFLTGTVEAYTHMYEAAKGPAAPASSKRRWLD